MTAAPSACIVQQRMINLKKNIVASSMSVLPVLVQIQSMHVAAMQRQRSVLTATDELACQQQPPAYCM